MPLHVESTGSRNLHHVETPKALRAIELDIAAASPQALPGTHRQILHAPYADAPVDRHTFRFHEPVVGHLRPLERPEACVLPRFRLMPMGLTWRIVHSLCSRFSNYALARGARSSGKSEDRSR